MINPDRIERNAKAIWRELMTTRTVLQPRRPTDDELWERDQDLYRRMAKAALEADDEACFR